MANFPPRAPSGSPSTQPPTGPAPAQPASAGAAGGSTPGAGSGAITGMHTAGVRPCPACSTLVNVHATVCPNCGESLANKEKLIRCRRCRHRASSNLVVCPHCGRDLQPATSRWLTWGAPLLLVLLLGGGLLLTGGRGSNPGSWAQAQVDRVVRFVQSLGARLQPDVTISMIPAGQDPNDPLVSQAALSAAPVSASGEVIDVAANGAAAATAPTVPSPEPPADAEAVQVPAEAPAEAPAEVPAEPTPAPTTEPTAAPTATAAPPTPTTVPTASPTASPTALPTATATTAAPVASAGALTRTGSITGAAAAPVTGTTSVTRTLALVAASRTPTATAEVLQGATASVSLLGLSTPTPVSPTATPQPTTAPTPAVQAVHEVRRGDTLFEIAQEYDVTVEDILAANGLTEDDVYTIQPGDDLNIPGPTPEGGAPAGATATPVPAVETYTVRAGDTMLAIANRYDVTVEDLLAANDMTINDARTLQPGDVLEIPGPAGVATATPIASPTATATTAPAAAPATAATATPGPDAGVRVDAPRLRAPENGAALSCAAQNTLVWLPVASVRPTDLYLVHLGYLNSVAADGAEEVIWVISQQRPISTTSWALDNDLCGLAPATAGRQWRWYVEVVEPTTDGLRPVSPPSSVWSFAWQ